MSSLNLFAASLEFVAIFHSKNSLKMFKLILDQLICKEQLVIEMNEVMFILCNKPGKPLSSMGSRSTISGAGRSS